MGGSGVVETSETAPLCSFRAFVAAIPSVVAGGLSPFIATMLLPYGPAALATYLVVMAGLTIVAVLAAAETRDRAID